MKVVAKQECYLRVPLMAPSLFSNCISRFLEFHTPKGQNFIVTTIFTGAPGCQVEINLLIFFHDEYTNTHSSLLKLKGEYDHLALLYFQRKLFSLFN